MAGDRVQITPGYGMGGISNETMKTLVGELWDSQRFQRLLEVQRQRPDCADVCTQEYQFEKTMGGFIAEVLACRKCKQIVVNLTRSAAA